MDLVPRRERLKKNPAPGEGGGWIGRGIGTRLSG